MAKMTKAQRSAAAKKAARTRKRNSISKRSKRRRPSTRAMSAPKRRKTRRRMSAKQKAMPMVKNAFSGAMGGGAWGLMSWAGIQSLPAGWRLMIGLLGGSIISALNGGAGAGFSGAAIASVFPKPGQSLSDMVHTRWVDDNTLADCGMRDAQGSPIYMDSMGNYWAMNDNGVYDIVPESEYALSDHSPISQSPYALSEANPYSLSDYDNNAGIAGVPLY